MSVSSVENIAIVTDSTADLPAQLLAEYNIHVIPNVVVIDGQDYQDGVTITRESFYRQLPEMTSQPTTATASSGVYEQLYERLLSAGHSHVLSIHASSRLSGIFNAASAAAKEFYGRVTVFDSHQLTMGIGFQVLTAAEGARQGQPMPRLLAALEQLRPRTRVVAMLDTLEYVRRSGRVSWARARLGELLRIKPFVLVEDGEVKSLGEARTRRRGEQRLHQLLNTFEPVERLAILHSNAPESAREFLSSLNTPAANPDTTLVVNVTPVIGVHVGPNGLGFAVVRQSL